MRLWERVGRQLRADAHGVMDRLEERSLLMKQHLREAELELDRGRARLEALDEEDRRLGESIEHARRELERLDADVELALGGDDAELARFTVRRLLPRRRALAALEERREQIARERPHLAAEWAERDERLRALRERVRVRLAADAQRLADPWPAEELVADEEVELELLRRRRGAGEGTR